MRPFDPSKCGTPGNYQQHRHRNEPACEPCRLAHNAYARERRAIRNAARPPRTLQPCGTYAAYRRHFRNGEDPCPECRQANTRHWAKHNAGKYISPTHCPEGHEYRHRDRAGRLYCQECRRPPLDPAECGTITNYERHRRDGEKPCRACRAAQQEYRKRLKKKDQVVEITPRPLRIPSFLSEMYREDVA